MRCTCTHVFTLSSLTPMDEVDAVKFGLNPGEFEHISPEDVRENPRSLIDL